MKPLKLSDLNTVLPYLDKANYEGYNSNFVTMMMWNHEYHIEYEIMITSASCYITIKDIAFLRCLLHLANTTKKLLNTWWIMQRKISSLL